MNKLKNDEQKIQPPDEEPIDIVDEASMESFPASDPPNYTQRTPSHDKEEKKEK